MIVKVDVSRNSILPPFYLNLCGGLMRAVGFAGILSLAIRE
jgi:hypothetical protein